jgi:hypothetical protein
VGYWDSHPLGGDQPWDYVDEIEFKLQKKERLDCDFGELDNKKYNTVIVTADAEG